MTWYHAEIDWLDTDGWAAHLRRLKADEPSAEREIQIAQTEEHLRLLAGFADTPENSPLTAASA